MYRFEVIKGFAIALMALLASSAMAQERAKDTYVRAVTRGAALMPWQTEGLSQAEGTFRAEIETRKRAMLQHSRDVVHPAIFTRADIERAKENAATSDWAQSWIDNQVALADEIVDKSQEWIENMLPFEAPAHGYGFTCPKCVGVKSQEAVGTSLVRWNYKDPDTFSCRSCGQIYPDPAYPETAALELPRTGHRITYYLNDAERANLEDRTGALAWHWVGYPIHVSFSGMIRERKIGFIRTAAQSLGFAYAFTGDERYAVAARRILVRYAQCYRQWPYRDYWDTYADCDPLYAAWHDKALPIEWKRHLSEQAFARDELDKASMLQNYWGAGRVHPSTDAVSGLGHLAIAYDFTCISPSWSAEDRRLVESDLLLEYIMGAEPYVGGPGNADNENNKAPRIYSAMAFVSKCLGIPEMADTALRGYERVRDASFNADGFCTESPSYNNMYLSQLLAVPETLHGFTWPESFEARSGVVDYYASDDKLRRMYRAVLWSLRGDGSYIPLSDTHIGNKPSAHIVHMGLRRYPDLFEGVLPRLKASYMSQYALFNLPSESLTVDTGLELPETYFPDWQTAVLRNGSSPDSAMATLALNPWGGHRHYDNLALYYEDSGQIVLGDLGYVGDMPVNKWIKSTQSHNLVVVDDSGQRNRERSPEFQMMATTPLASVVEATSTAYAQCSEYSRRVAMVKVSEGHTFMVDVFRVKGGAKHAFRVFSEIAASDTVNGRLEIDGVVMPHEVPFPDVGSSLDPKDIFGLRDVRSATPGGLWRATWQDDARGYRLWMLSDCDRVEASNGPGQRSLTEAGRRVRYVDAIREGEDLESVFVAVHEPSRGVSNWLIQNVERIDVESGIAIRVETSVGDYFLLNDFDEAGEAHGFEFQGRFAAAHVVGDEVVSYMTVGAKRFLRGGVGFESDEAVVRGDTLTAVVNSGDSEIGQYARVLTADGWKGYPVARVDNLLHVRDYPLAEGVTEFVAPTVRYETLTDE